MRIQREMDIFMEQDMVLLVHLVFSVPKATLQLQMSVCLFICPSAKPLNLHPSFPSAYFICIFIILQLIQQHSMMDGRCKKFNKLMIMTYTHELQKFVIRHQNLSFISNFDQTVKEMMLDSRTLSRISVSWDLRYYMWGFWSPDPHHCIYGL